MRVALTIFVTALLFTHHAHAQDAIGANTLKKNAGGTNSQEDIKAGMTGYHQFTAAGVHSARFNVNASYADVCIDTDTATTSDSGARIALRRIMSAPTEVGSFAPVNSTLDGTDCFTVTTGPWYIEVTAAPGAAETVLVTVTGRDR